MTQHKFHQDELVAVWRRHTIGVSSETQEEAENLIRDNGIANTPAWESDDCDGRIQLLEDGRFLYIQDNVRSINSYQNDIMTSGCHRLAYEEMRNCMTQLGVAA